MWILILRQNSLYKQALIKLDHHQRAADELSNLLRKCNLKKQFYVNEFQESSVCVEELEEAMKQIAHQATESTCRRSCHALNLTWCHQRVKFLTWTHRWPLCGKQGLRPYHKLRRWRLLWARRNKFWGAKKTVLETNEIFIDLKKRVLEIEREKASCG